jgi:type IV pilus assembly protein PilA
MRCRERSSAGFTLIELMIVVAIIGVLSTIGISNFLKYQKRAKTSEAMTNVAAIVVGEKSYFTEKGSYLHITSPSPLAIPGNTRTTCSGNADFDRLGWEPEGPVYFKYVVSADDQGLGRFTVEASGDIDGDGNASFFGHVVAGAGAGIDGRLDDSTCAGTGTFDPGSGTKSRWNSTGPCDALSGNSRF